MSWYKTGQIAVTNGSRVIVGVGTNFTRFVEVGEALLGPDGQHYEITSVPSATELRIGKDYAGPTAANQSYAIVPVQGYVRELAHKAADLIDTHRAVPAEALSYAESAEQSAAEAQAAKIELQEARDASASSAAQAAISASEAAGAAAQVEDSASRAGASASQALSSAQSASASKADAEAAAVSAQNRAAAAAGNASSSASSASESAMSAAKSATSATEAANSAAAAAVSSAQALTRANAAGVSASESEQASLAAIAAKTSAQDFANAAAESASSSSAAAVFAEGLSVQANQSASSAAASALLAQNAKSSAQAEAALAQAAKTDAQTASNSASANAVNAAASADAASQSELASGMSEIAAAASEAAAHSAKVAAELANAAAASSAAESASSASAARASKEEAAATVSVVTDARDAALAHTATAKAWADKLDGEVEPGKYSARYWAEIIAGAATGGVVYMGTWSAAGGAFPSGPSRGHLYKVSVAGEIDGVNYSVKDMIIFNGESWDKIDSTDEVTSVAGRVGAVLLTKVDVGLENVDNTADLAKPVSAAQQAALNQKQDTLVSGESIKRLNGESLLGSGDVTISKSSLGLGNVDNTTDLDKPVSTAQRAALDQKQNILISGESIKTLNGAPLLGSGDIAISKATLGLENVNNTADLDKPVSAAQQAALDQKQNALVSGENIKTINGTSLLGGGDIEISGGVEFVRKTAAVTLTDKQGIIADTSGGSFVVKLPAAPAEGAQVFVNDGGDWAINNLTVDPQGAQVEGFAAGENVILNVGGISVHFVFDGSKWQVYCQGAGVTGEALAKTGGDLNGNLNFAGTGRRITGNFSSSTPTDKLVLQSSVFNGPTNVDLVPNGNSSGSAVRALNSSGQINASLCAIGINGSFAFVESNRYGSGAHLPLAFWVGGYEAFRVNTNQTVSDLKVTGLNGGPIGGFRNRIINGRMEIAQRGTSFISATMGQLTLDRWVIGGSGVDAVVNVSQAGGDGFARSALAIGVAAPDTSISASQSLNIQQKIEGFNIQDMVGVPITLSFRVYSSKAGIHCVSFANAATDRSYVAEYVVNVANTWESKSITIPGGLITDGTWDFFSGTGLGVRWALAAGANLQTTPNEWKVGNFQSTPNQVNCLDAANNLFALGSVQLELGTVATPFERRPYGLELALCQRYYYRVKPGAGQPFAFGANYRSDYARFALNFPVTMRVAPTALEHSGVASHYAIAQSGIGNTALIAAPMFSVTTQNLATFSAQVASGLTVFNPSTLSAEATNGAEAFLAWSAEL